MEIWLRVPHAIQTDELYVVAGMGNKNGMFCMVRMIVSSCCTLLVFDVYFDWYFDEALWSTYSGVKYSVCLIFLPVHP